MATPTTKERDDARFMVLDGAASSEGARRVVFALSRGLVHQRRKRPTERYQLTLAAILCDFLRAAEADPKRWSYRQMRPAAFTSQRIGYRTFATAVADMQRNGFIELSKGHQQWNAEGFGGETRLPLWSMATRFRATDWLLRYMADEGLTPDSWRDHFELIEPDQPLVRDSLVLRRRNIRHKGEKYRGYTMRVDLEDPKARSLKGRMDRLNRFFLNHVVEPLPLRGFRRIFNNGESPDFDWNKGGRLYAVGGGYQNMRREDRPKITIDGEPVAEIDVKGSHIFILSARRGMPLDPTTDPYSVEGLPRTLVKAVVTMTVGHECFHKRWPSEVKKDLEKKLGVRLGRAYPLSKVLPLIVQNLPAMDRWGNTNISCFDLQFIESEALLLAVERLAYDHGIVTLPLHDSLIVPVSKLELAMEVLAQSFEDVTAYRPQLTVTLEGEGEAKEETDNPYIPAGEDGGLMPSSRGYTGNTFHLTHVVEALRAPHRKIIDLLSALSRVPR